MIGPGQSSGMRGPGWAERGHAAQNLCVTRA